MKTFRLVLRDPIRYEAIDNVSSFIGEDASGSFGILANHARLMTRLVFGLARFKVINGSWQYLAMPGGMLYFTGNELTLNCRRWIRGDNYEDISNNLSQILDTEEQNLLEMKRNLHRIEENILRYMMEVEKRAPEL